MECWVRSTDPIDSQDEGDAVGLSTENEQKPAGCRLMGSAGFGVGRNVGIQTWQGSNCHN
jgi:hypothetical protein